MGKFAKPYRSPKLAFEVSVRMWRKKKSRGKMTKDVKMVVTAHSPAEAEALVTTKLWRRAHVRKKFKRLQITDTRFHDSEPELSQATINASERMLGLVQRRLHKEMFS